MRTAFIGVISARTITLAYAGLAGLLATQAARALTFNVSTTTELVSAITSANGSAGPHTINLAAGTYNLSGELPVIAANENITFQGGSANPADTVLHQTTANTRILETALPANNVNNILLTFNSLTFDNGQGGDFGGGALLVGGIGSATTANNCVFSNNRTSSGANVHAGGAIENSPNGNVTVSGCRFSGNASAVYGGAIDFLNQAGGSGNLVVSNCAFIGNSAASDGGAIKASAGPGSITITDCSFESNQTTGSARGGAIAHGDGSITVHHNRFFNNTAANHANGDTLFQPGGEPVLDANENWWGQNSGPGPTDIYAVGTVTATTWLQLRFVAGASTLGAGGSTGLTADLLGLNSGGPLAAADLQGLPAVPSSPTAIFHDPILGSLSGASTQFAQGIATATFTAGATKGLASVAASLDNQTLGVTIGLPTTVSSITRVSTTPSNLGSVQWTVTFADPVSGLAEQPQLGQHRAGRHTCNYRCECGRSCSRDCLDRDRQHRFGYGHARLEPGERDRHFGARHWLDLYWRAVHNLTWSRPQRRSRALHRPIPPAARQRSRSRAMTSAAVWPDSNSAGMAILPRPRCGVSAR